MATKNPKKNGPQGGKKGLIPGIQEGISNMKQGVHDALYGRKAQDTPGNIAQANRKAGEELVSVLRAVDLGGLRRAEGVTPEQINDMRMSVRALISTVENAPTIFDDMSEMDEILLETAHSFDMAAKSGFVNQAQWCISAISAALLLLRDNVPLTDKAERERVIRDRVAYMENYKNLINAYGQIDETEAAIAKGEATLASLRAEYEPLKQELEEQSNTADGLAAIGRIKANINHPEALKEADQQMMVKARHAGDLASSITRTSNQQYARIMKKESTTTIALGYRTALDDMPALYNQDLLGDYKVLLKELNSNINRMLSDAAAVLDVEERAAREMEIIMNGDAAQRLAVYSVKSLDQLVMPEHRLSEREKLEAELFKSKQNRAMQQALEDENRLRQLLKVAETQKNAVVETEKLFDDVAAEDVQRQEQSNENGELLYNLNS